jgi:hypothetical protein
LRAPPGSTARPSCLRPSPPVDTASQESRRRSIRNQVCRTAHVHPRGLNHKANRRNDEWHAERASSRTPSQRPPSPGPVGCNMEFGWRSRSAKTQSHLLCLRARGKHARQVALQVAQSLPSRMQRPYPKGGRACDLPRRGAQACPVVTLSARQGAMVLVEDAATCQQPAR